MVKLHVLSYENIFGEELNGEIDAIVRDLPKNAAVQWISSLLHQLTFLHKDEQKFHGIQLLQWILQMGSPDKSILSTWVRDHLWFINQKGWMLFTKTSALQLARTLLRSGSDDPGELNPQNYSTLLRALLASNTRENKKSSEMVDLRDDCDLEERMNYMIPVQAAALELNRKKDYHVPLIKAKVLFEFLAQNPKYAKDLNIFLNNYGFSKANEYLESVFNFFLNIAVNENPSNKITIDSHNQKLIKFFDHFCINGKPIEKGYKYTDLQSYPLFKVNENTYSILYISFFIDKLFQGFIFDFVRIVQQEGHTEISLGNLKANLGLAFSEEELFYSVIKKCVTHEVDMALSGRELTRIIGAGAPDYYLRKGKSIFILEMKDLMLNDMIKHSGNIDLIKKEILHKLERTAAGQIKGIFQLIATIKKIQRGTYAKFDAAIGRDFMIYPVIVHTELALEAEGVNHFLRQRMQQAILDNSLHNIGDIQPIILINLDTLLLLQDHFSVGEINLLDMLLSYKDYIIDGPDQNKMVCFDEWAKRYVVRKTGKYPMTSKSVSEILKSFC